MRISDWSSDVCSSDLAPRLYFDAQDFLAIFQETELPQPFIRLQRTLTPLRVMGKCFGPIGINADMVEDGQGLRGFPFRDIGQPFLGQLQCAVVARAPSRGAADASARSIVLDMGAVLLVASPARRASGHIHPM